MSIYGDVFVGYALNKKMIKDISKKLLKKNKQNKKIYYIGIWRRCRK